MTTLWQLLSEGRRPDIPGRRFRLLLDRSMIAVGWLAEGRSEPAAAAS
ncbi:hypothetical protein [Actinomycetospora soli]|nr:hypothetical protein [Actinomycetospora soli]MCD2191155.1 hypothetical protein [Actinomycetospora soli]